MSNQKNDFYHNSAELPLIRGVRPTVELVNIMYEEYTLSEMKLEIGVRVRKNEERLKEAGKLEATAQTKHKKAEKDFLDDNETSSAAIAKGKKAPKAKLSKVDLEKRKQHVADMEMIWKQKQKQTNLFRNSTETCQMQLNSVEAELDEKSRATSKLLGKHYRTISIKLHPDKNDGLPREVFDRFKVYMDILRDDQKRLQYLSQMLNIQRTMPDYTLHSHKVWMKANTDIDESDENKPSGKKGDKDSMRVIMTGELAQKPKKPLLLQFAGKHIARLRFTIPPAYEQYLPCTLRWELLTMRVTNQTQSVLVTSCETDLDINLMNFGHYELRFCAETDSHAGHWSDAVNVDHTDPESVGYNVAIAEQERILYTRSDSVRTQMNIISRCLLQRSSLSKTDLTLNTGERNSLMEQLEKHEKFADDLHRLIVRAQSSANRLGYLLNSTFDPRVSNATLLCDRAKELLNQIEVDMARVQTKDSNRQFVRFIGGMLESHDFQIWLADENMSSDLITKSCEGASMNRLYQLLVEGKASSLEITAEVCDEASKRNDWFNHKQCERLEQRRDELERIETKRDREENDKSEKDAQLRLTSAANEMEGGSATGAQLLTPVGILKNSNKPKVNAAAAFAAAASAPAPAAAAPAYKVADPPGSSGSSDPTFDWSGYDVFLHQLQRDEAGFNGRSGQVTWKLGGNKWAVKLGPPAINERSDKGALTVFDFQMRCMTSAEQGTVKLQNEKLYKAIEDREQLEKQQKNAEAEQKDVQQAIKLAEQSAKRIQMEKRGIDPTIISQTVAEVVAPQTTPSNAAKPKQFGFTYSSTFARERVSGTIASFDKGVGFISYREKQKPKKIFFHLSEVLVPVELEATFPSKTVRTTWLFRHIVKQTRVEFQIGNFQRNTVAEKITLADLTLEAPRKQEASVCDSPNSSPSSAAPISHNTDKNLSKNQKKTQKKLELEMQQKAELAADTIAPNPTSGATTLAPGNVWGGNSKKYRSPPAQAQVSALPPAPSFLKPPSSGDGGLGGGELPTPPPGYKPSFSNSNNKNNSSEKGIVDLLYTGPPPTAGLVSSGAFTSSGGSSPSSNPISIVSGASFSAFGVSGGLPVGLSSSNNGDSSSLVTNDSSVSSDSSHDDHASKLRKLATRYLSKRLFLQCRQLMSASNYAGDRISYFPFLRQQFGSSNDDIFRGMVIARKNIPCSVKKISRTKCTNDERELKLLKNLVHKNILRIWDVHADVESIFVASDLYHGNLEMLVNSGIEDKTTKIRILSQTLNAIEFLHSNDIAHRDIKLASICYICSGSDSYNIMLTDFGIKERGHPSSKGFQAQELVLKNNGELEDASWTPSNDDYKKCDVFSFGVVSFMVLTDGKHPFSNPDPKKARREADRENRIADGENPNLADIEDKEAMHLIQNCLSHDSAMRPSSERLARFHPLFFTAQRRAQAIISVEAGGQNLQYLEKFCTSWNWKDAFFDLFEDDGSLMGADGEEVYFNKYGRELIRFTKFLITKWESFNYDSKVKNAVSNFKMTRNNTASFIEEFFNVGEDNSDDALVIITDFLKYRVTLFWCWLFEDHGGEQ